MTTLYTTYTHFEDDGGSGSIKYWEDEAQSSGLEINWIDDDEEADDIDICLAKTMRTTDLEQSGDLFESPTASPSPVPSSLASTLDVYPDALRGTGATALFSYEAGPLATTMSKQPTRSSALCSTPQDSCRNWGSCGDEWQWSTLLWML